MPSVTDYEFEKSNTKTRRMHTAKNTRVNHISEMAKNSYSCKCGASCLFHMISIAHHMV